MTKYLIVGSGRLAKHISCYLTLLKIPYSTWSRKSPIDTRERLAALAEKAQRTLLLISDNEIPHFVKSNDFLKNHFLVHCSGSHSFTFAKSAHPLNTFGPELYDLNTYSQTPFVIDDNGPEFSEILPGLPNPVFKLDPNKKSLYHALCVMSGNFSTLLWQNTFERFATELHLPPEILFQYVKSVTQNLMLAPNDALTGPLKRGDTSTLVRNLDALNNTPEQNLYYAFLNFYLAKNKSRGEQKNDHLGI